MLPLTPDCLMNAPSFDWGTVSFANEVVASRRLLPVIRLRRRSEGVWRMPAKAGRMRLRAGLAVVAVVTLLGGATAFGLGVDPGDLSGGGGNLTEVWPSETGVPVTGNHHAVAAGRVDGRGHVFAPLSGKPDTDHCRMVALDAEDGSSGWSHRVPPDDCMIHAVGTVSLGDYDADGTAEVFVPTSEERLYAFDPATGEAELVYDLDEYGYSQAIVGPLGPDGGARVAIVDALGTVEVVRPDGGTAWTRREDSYVWATPAVSDFAGDGGTRLVVGFGEGYVTAYGRDGDVAWNRSLSGNGSITWMTTGDVGGDGATDAVVATDAGAVHLLDGPDGDVRWTRNFGDLAAVEAVADGDADGTLEVYATAKDGVLRALEAETGQTEWETDLAEDPVQMTPPPVLGDLDGDADPELVGVTSDGQVTVVDPADGGVLGRYQRSTPFWETDASTALWTRATLADTDGDGAEEVFVIYGDGRVVALTYGGA